MTTLEKYFELKQKWCEAKTDEEYDSLGKELVKFRDENFTRDDWNELINQSSGRARFEYKRMKNAKFPEREEAMELFGLNNTENK